MLLIIKNKRSQILFISSIGNKYIQVEGPIAKKAIELKPDIIKAIDLKPRVKG